MAWREGGEVPIIRVVKLGGGVLELPADYQRLVAYIRSTHDPTVLVHGGGERVDALQRRLGKEPVKIDGLRRTGEDELETVLMSLCGSVNKQLVAGLIGAGLQAVGLAGIDGGLVRVRKMDHPDGDLGFVGEVVDVNPAVVESLLARNLTPVVAPLSLGLDGHIYNVNADQIATALACALDADMIEFISNVSGVLIDGEVVRVLDAALALSLIEGARVAGGMVPKLLAAITAVESCVDQARIVDLAGLFNGDGTQVRGAMRR